MATTGDTRLGTTLAGYRIERLLGRGGMSVVYLAEDLRLGRRVALKLIAPDLAGDERFRERFLRESRIAASLDHSNVIPIYEAGEADGSLYLAMRYVDGTELETVLRERAPLPPAEALDVVAQAAGALDLAHERGLVHCDVKPGNILLADEDRRGARHVYLSDFGLTKQASSDSGLTETGQFVGTADYISPEQIEHDEVGPRSDVYSLACVLFRCLTGEPPFRRDSLMSLLWAHVHDAPPRASERNPELPAALDPVLARGLAKRPQDRYGTCAELVAAARDALPREGAARRLARRPTLVLAGLAVAAAVAALALGLAVVSREDAVAEPTVEVGVSSLQRLDAATGRLVATVPLSGQVGALAASAEGVWALDAERGGFWRVDPRTNEVTATGSVAGDPAGIAAGLGSVWVPHRQGATATTATVTQIDPASGRVARALPLPVRQRIPTEPMLAGLAVQTTPPALWVASPFELAVHRLRPRLGTAVARVEVGETAPRSLAAGFGSVWVARAYALDRVDPAREAVAATITLPFSPRDVAVGAGAVWLANGTGDAVWVVDPAENRVVDRIPVGDEPVGLAVAADAVWVANRDGTVHRIDPARGAVARTVRVGGRPYDVAVHGDAVFVSVRPLPGEADGGTADERYVAGLQEIMRRHDELWRDANQPIYWSTGAFTLTPAQARRLQREASDAGREVALVARAGLGEVRALDPPERYAADHAAFVRGLERYLRRYERLAAAIERADAAAIDAGISGINTEVVAVRRSLSDAFKELVDVSPIRAF